MTLPESVIKAAKIENGDFDPEIRHKVFEYLRSKIESERALYQRQIERLNASPRFKDAEILRYSEIMVWECQKVLDWMDTRPPLPPREDSKPGPDFPVKKKCKDCLNIICNNPRFGNGNFMCGHQDDP